MQTHYLKCWPTYYDAMEREEKTFEIRSDDRDFQLGDTLVLRRTISDENHEVDVCPITGKPRHEIKRTVTYILNGGQFGIERGYVAMATTPLPKEPSA